MKPDVLSDEELKEQIALEVHDWHCPDEKGIVETYWTGPSMQDYLECADVILPYIQQAKAEVAREIRFQILEWFRNYAHQLDRKFPHPTTEEQGWLGNIWDMIHMAGKEDFGNEFLKEAA